jgi:Cation transporter/ATPase, N-terminus
MHAASTTKTSQSLTNMVVRALLLNLLILGFEGMCNKLRVDSKVGLTGNDFAERTEKFGNNYREEPVAKTWISLFIGALDDQMLKLLIVCAIFSITFDMILADHEERQTGKN